MSSLGNLPLVSVVMIFRDAERFFDEAIDSVLVQTYPAIELLLCDDGSSDTSTAIALGRATSHSATVRYLHHPDHAHQGMSSTRNLGINASRGELVAFLDADDYWQPTHLAHEVRMLADHPNAGMVCGQAIDWFSWADPRASDKYGQLAWPPGTVLSPPRMLTALLRNDALRTPTCSLLVRKRVLHAVGGSERRFMAMYEDQVLLVKLFLSETCVISGSRTAFYRRHSGSMTARALAEGSYHPARSNDARETFLLWLKAYLTGQNGPEVDELRTLVARELGQYGGLRLRARVRAAAKAALPSTASRQLKRVVRRARDLGPVRMGSLRRLSPLSRQFGYDRGLPVDRYYIEQFLARHAHLISGDVLEVGDPEYTRRFGGVRVTKSDVLNIAAGETTTTIVADLADGDHLASDSFDCIILTQTIHLIYDLEAAVQTLHRILRPGGTLLVTTPGISQLSSDRWAGTWFWSLTPMSAGQLFGKAFGSENVHVSAFGNVLTAVAFLEGMASHELRVSELDHLDPQFPVLVTVRAHRTVINQSSESLSSDGQGAR